MRGVYTATHKIAGLVTAKTLLYIEVAVGKPVIVLATHVTNVSNETNEQMDITWQKITTLGAPGATTITPAKHENGDQAAACVVKGNVTSSEPTYGSAGVDEMGHGSGAASLTGWHYERSPEERVQFGSDTDWGLRLLNTPTSFDCIIEVTFQETG